MRLCRQNGISAKTFQTGIYCIVNAKSHNNKKHVSADALLLLTARVGQEITLRCIHFVLFSALTTTVPFLLLYHTTFPLIPAKTEALYLIVGRDFLFPADISPCPVLLSILSQLFPPHNQLSILCREDIVSVLETDDNRSATNFPDIITISSFYLVMKLHK